MSSELICPQCGHEQEFLAGRPAHKANLYCPRCREDEEMRSDAALYRWLRKQHWNDSTIACVVNPKRAVKPGHDCPSLDRLDDFIRAAMQEEGTNPR